MAHVSTIIGKSRQTHLRSRAVGKYCWAESLCARFLSAFLLSYTVEGVVLLTVG